MSVGWTYLVSKGAFPNLSSVGYIGRNRLITSLTVPEDIWPYGGLYPFASFDATGEGVGLVLYASSTETADNQVITVIGLDENWCDQVKEVTLNGRNQVQIDGQWKRVNATINLNGTSTTGDVYIAESDSLTLGVPDTPSKIKQLMPQEDQNAASAVRTIGACTQAYFLDVWGSMVVSGVAPTNAAVEIATFIRYYGGIFFNAGTISLMTNGLPIWNYHPKLVIDPLPPRTDIVGRVINASDDVDISAGYELLIEKI